MSKKNSTKSKREFLSGYKTYNPAKEGYGNPEEWVESFRERMGFDRAKQVVGNRDPLSILGLYGNPTWDEIKKAYKKMIVRWHPDKEHGDAQKTLEINAAFELLEIQYGM